MKYPQIKSRYTSAVRNKYALGAFNFCDSNIAMAIFSAARKLHAPIIMETSSGEMHYLNQFVARGIADGLNRIEKNIFILHLDHGKTLENVKQAIKAGYDSVHFDGSALPYEENLKLTKQAAQLAHKHGLWIEGELGHVGGSSTLHKQVSYSKVKLIKTDPDQAKEFVQHTGIDSLASNIGNVHGIWKGLPNIDFKLLAKLHKTIKIPLVLHGGSGIADFQIRKAISLGIAKINVNSEMRIAFSKSLRKSLKDPEMFVPTSYLPDAISAVENVVQSKIRLFRSMNKLSRKL